MVVFPNAKINLGLNIVSKRKDGYHNIESCFYPIPFCDILEILPADELSFTSTGIFIPGSSEHNLCLKAYKLLKADFDLPPVQIHLHKIIPIGAGLGGGSADATFTLKILNDLFNLNLLDEQLENYAAQLGSDCPFFVKNKPVFATGTGTTFEDCELDLIGYYLILTYPKIHIGTKEAYAGVVPHRPSIPIKEVITRGMGDWKLNLKNEFEDSIFPSHPEIKNLKNRFYENGALYVSMTGSGSAVYGVFENEPSEKISDVVWQGKL